MSIIQRQHDLNHSDVPADCGQIGCDTETTGLDHHHARLCTCQFCFDNGQVFVIRVDDSRPEVICQLLADRRIKKVFHHATFDLKFMVAAWSARPANIMCTKIASKLLDPERQQDHTLKSLLAERLGVELDKAARLSDWGTDLLSEEQLRYAARDAQYLADLMRVLETELRSKRLWQLAQACFRHIPIRVRLELAGYGDVFAY